MTDDEPSLKPWNEMLLQLNEALVGKVTPNLRRVTLAHIDAVWTIDFVLEADSDIDREEISETVAAFEALQMVQLPLAFRVQVTTDALSWPGEGVRVAYWRREGA